MALGMSRRYYTSFAKRIAAPSPEAKYCSSRRRFSIERERPVIVPYPEPANWLARSMILLGTGVGLAFAAYFYLGRPPIEAKKTSTAAVRPERITVGGPFSLLDQSGKVVSNSDFFGKWSLIYIGYTHCPEDCPRQLEKIASVVHQLGKSIVPIFITADPERDNTVQLKHYLREFHPGFVGLTGKPSDVRPVLWKFRAFFRKTDEDRSDYLVEHSSNVYLMNTKMECIKVFGPEYHDKALVDAITKEMTKAAAMEGTQAL
ncbi:protein SCO1 homolog 1, mitochondrial isoform X1 [Selaginella moellendorffii]|nr:protein SCO1 homolog 1, mitochondrial isoform X1 [Selaginella moellendorffii]|eukprot:XP_024525587.1 protein SCO1 homolog 1, mitochondrial isoform X1 [Selaginella moellendorffii]